MKAFDQYGLMIEEGISYLMQILPTFTNSIADLKQKYSIEIGKLMTNLLIYVFLS